MWDKKSITALNKWWLWTESSYSLHPTPEQWFIILDVGESVFVSACVYLCVRESELHYSSFNCLLLANFPEAVLLTGHELVLLRDISRVLHPSAPCRQQYLSILTQSTMQKLISCNCCHMNSLSIKLVNPMKIPHHALLSAFSYQGNCGKSGHFSCLTCRQHPFKYSWLIQRALIYLERAIHSHSSQWQ